MKTPGMMGMQTRTKKHNLFPGIILCQIGYENVEGGETLEYSLQNAYSGGAAFLTADQIRQFCQMVIDAEGIEGIFEE